MMLKMINATAGAALIVAGLSGVAHAQTQTNAATAQQGQVLREGRSAYVARQAYQWESNGQTANGARPFAPTTGRDN